MSAHDDIDEVRRRIRGLEYDLAQLKARLDAIAVQGSLPPPLVPPPAPAAAVTETPLHVAPQMLPSPEPAPTYSQPVHPSDASSPPLLVNPTIAVPPPLAQPAAAAQPPAPDSGAAREWLERLQLWPPSGEENAEVRLAAWWATRIGALLAVIGVVFFGLYVSRNSPPWVRLAEVGTVSIAMLVLGGWLERKLPKFGAVVFGAGLALAYFCAFAAYAVAPMKVITSPVVASAGELAVVIGIFAIAWRRGSPVVASMAVVLGHVTALLALRDGPENYGPWVVLLLGVAAVVLRLARSWNAPSLLAMPLAWLFLVVAAVGRDGALAMSVPAAWFWMTLFFTLYFLRDWIAAWRGRVLTGLDRALQVANSSFAVAVGLFVTAQVGGARLTQFYFGSGVMLLAATVAWQRVAAGGTLAPVLACKAAGLIALGVITELDGHARSLVLLAQAFVMLVSARHSTVRGLGAATIFAGALALAFFLSELRPENSMLLVRQTGFEVLFLGAASGFVAALQRWLSLDGARTAFGAVVVGLAAIATTLTWDAQDWAPALGIGVGVLLCAVQAALRAWLPAAVVGAMLFVAAHVEMWSYEVPPFMPWQLWSNEGVLLVAALVAAAGLARRKDSASVMQARGALALLAGGTFLAVCFEAFAATQALAIAAGLAALLAFAAERVRTWPMAAASAPLLALGLGLFFLNGGKGEANWLWLAAALGWAAPAWLAASALRWDTIRHVGGRTISPALQTTLATAVTLLALNANLQGETRIVGTTAAALAVFGLAWRPGLRPALEASWALWLSALIYVSDIGASLGTWVAFGLSWLPAVALAQRQRFGEISPPPPFWRARVQGMQVTLAMLIGAVIAVDLSGHRRLAALGCILAAGFASWRWGGVAAARTAVLWSAAAGWLAAWFFASKHAAQGGGVGLAAIIATGGVIALLAFALERDVAPTVRQRFRWLTSVAALALIFHALAVQRGAVADHATVGWGLAAVGMFLAGLFLRSRPHRLTGLAGLALCVPRAFLIDLDSTLHRIAAFVALGVVLLWVGFSYHRFRHLIVDDDKKL